jgi:hypothetical protein
MCLNAAPSKRLDAGLTQLGPGTTTTQGYMVCADPDCPKLRFWADNFLWTFAAAAANPSP